MQTGIYNNLTGNINDIGPMYPFVGFEIHMVVVAVFIWLYWHYKQIKIENNEIKHILELTKNEKVQSQHISRINTNNR